MKKYLLIAFVGFLAIPLLNSCDKPTGDPEKDAQAFAGELEKQQELMFDIQKKTVEYAEFYAEKGDSKNFEKFKNKYELLQSKVIERFENNNKKEIKELEKRLEDVEKKLEDADNNSDNDEESTSKD